MKVHIHEDQMDGHLHTACWRADDRKALIAFEDEFEKTPADKRCRYCERIQWPHGTPPWAAR